ncbi:MFS transporter [Pygmaiobacter massiliensis]|uniref:MFS transporter n=1 Tax=Pygmaiobacter massiliensis TaxID=1917873 RepID=UPI0028990A2D|nr:MFS transporter [Pygmaiobacter massiliensis]
MTILLVLIYLAFIGLGLPDSLLGAAWPQLRIDIGAPLSGAGMVSMIVTAGTIVSSLVSARVIRRFGTGKVTAVSTALTAAALLGYAFAPAYWWLCIMAIPLGLGAGAVDAALNNFVALHYKAHHMSWLHCFWGLGATAGPILLSVFLVRPQGWRTGIRSIGLLQLALVVVLTVSLPLWRKVTEKNEIGSDATSEPVSNREALRLRGLPAALLTFFCYCGAELSCGLWASSFLVASRGVAPAQAAGWVSLYYAGITAGRFFSGFAMHRLTCPAMIRLGGLTSLAGCVMLVLPLPTVFSAVALVLIGLGCAPVYPCMIHETPARFGEANSQTAMGLQMSTAYCGSTLMPPLLGLLAQLVSVTVFPWFLMVLFGLMLVASEVAARLTQPHAS